MPMYMYIESIKVLLKLFAVLSCFLGSTAALTVVSIRLNPFLFHIVGLNVRCIDQMMILYYVQ